MFLPHIMETAGIVDGGNALIRVTQVPNGSLTPGATLVWGSLILSSTTIIALVFAFWELIENRFFRDLDYVSLHYLYISRGITASILLATDSGAGGGLRLQALTERKSGSSRILRRAGTQSKSPTNIIANNVAGWDGARWTSSTTP
jgi:hypothetical protein